MKRIWQLAIAIVLATAGPAGATAEHTYEADEYAGIAEGLSPDRKLSLAAHAEGDGGFEKFHVWLMAEPAHRRLSALAGIGSSNNLDTAPSAYRAAWAPDSRHVAVSFRSNRHVIQLNLYAVTRRHRAVLVEGPSSFSDVLGREISGDDDMRYHATVLTWTNSRRFVLSQNLLLMGRDQALAARLGRYARIDGPRDDGKVTIQFAAEADCLLLPGNRYRIIDLRPGAFLDKPN